MKKIILTFVLVFIGFSCHSQSKSMNVQTSFNGFHCDGKQGLCDIDNQSDRTLSNATLTLQDEQLTMLIDRSKLSPDEENNIYGNPTRSSGSLAYFRVTESFKIPESVAKNLSLEDRSFQIKKGDYLITTTQQFISINFKLK